MVKKKAYDSKDDLENVIKDITDDLLPHAAVRIGISLNELKNRLKILFVDSDEIDIFVETSNNWRTFTITVNRSLMIYYHKMLKVFVGFCGIGDDEAHAIEKPAISLNETVVICKKLIQSYWNGKLMYTKGLLLNELGMEQITVLSRLLHSCECYDLAHELGHVVIGTSKDILPEISISKNNVEDFLTHIPDLSDDVKHTLITPWTEETAADLIGLQLLLAQPNTKYIDWENYKQWLCAGAEITHTLHYMLNEYNDRINHKSKTTITSSHPHDYVRILAIRSSPENISFSDKLKLGNKFGRFALGVLDEIFK